MKPLPLALYGAATRLLEPLAPQVLQARARRGKEDPARLAERLGRAAAPRPPGPLVWLHGVSVGESASLLPLVAALRRRRPDLTVLVTSGTVTSAQVLARRLPPGVIHQFAPVDAPGAVARFLDHWRPGLAVLVESELWPNLILAAKERGVRLALASARMTEASAAGWARAPASARALLGAFDAVLPQDDATAARLARLGARTGPHLNLKRAGDPLPCDAAELERLRGLLAGRPVVLAASTHPGEEPILAAAVRAAAPDALTIIAPRHPERGGALAAELAAPRRGAGELPKPDDALYVADTLGELGLFFRLADVVVMGGSFRPGIGGHNPLEPARLGCAILTGPHVFNAADLYAEMSDAGAAIVLTGPDALQAELRRLLGAAPTRETPPRETPTREGLGRAALAYAERQGAQLDAALAVLDPLLPA